MNSCVKFAVTLNILVLLSILFTNSASGQNDTEPTPSPTEGAAPTPTGDGIIEHTSNPQSFITDYDTIVFLVIAAIIVAIIGIGLHKVKSHRSKKHAGDSVEVLMRGGIGK